jgi:hypothetical protein
LRRWQEKIDTLAGFWTQWANSNTNRQVSHVGKKCGTIGRVATSDQHIGSSLTKTPARIRCETGTETVELPQERGVKAALWCDLAMPLPMPFEPPVTTTELPAIDENMMQADVEGKQLFLLL